MPEHLAPHGEDFTAPAEELVDDVEKAEVVAREEHPYRSAAAEERESAAKHTDRADFEKTVGFESEEFSRISADYHSRRAEAYDRRADEVGEVAGKQYDSDKPLDKD